MSSVDGYVDVGLSWLTFGREGMERSGDDCNHETTTRSDDSGIGVMPNEL